MFFQFRDQNEEKKWGADKRGYDSDGNIDRCHNVFSKEVGQYQKQSADKNSKINQEAK